MSSNLRDRLSGLADEAPTRLSGEVDLWSAGLRRDRLRKLGATTAVAALVLVCAVLLPLVTPNGAPQPVDAPQSSLHLPRTVHVPDPWADGTADTGPPGRLAALSMAPRAHPEGVTGTTTTLDPFGVSAVDGTAVFLDLPASRSEPGETILGYGWLTLSPDGRKVAYAVGHQDARSGRTAVNGWNVYDTTTGRLLRLRDPENTVIRGMDVFELAFSGDSRYLLTNYSPTGSNGSRKDALVVWDVETGRPTVAEGTGHYWLPEPGAGPRGVVWSRGRRIWTFDPATGKTLEQVMPREVVEASYGPDGDAVAYIGHRPSGPDEAVPWFLYAGPSATETARMDLGIRAGHILGWRDAAHVVVGDYQRRGRVVDVRTGDVVALDRLRWAPDLGMSPVYAADLWANSLVETPRPAVATDPRWWLRWPVWLLVVALALGAAVGVRRRRVGA